MAAAFRKHQGSEESAVRLCHDEQIQTWLILSYLRRHSGARVSA
jgi:hypothetical protein